MNNKEAIRILGLERDDWETSHCTPFERREAFDMAISALQELDNNSINSINNSINSISNSINSINNSTNGIDSYVKGLTACRVPEDSLISRQAAIYAIYEICNEPVAWLMRAAREIEKLPSVQPEIIRCRDCEYGKQDEYGRWYCRDLGCQIGDEDGSGFCANAERRTDEQT